MPRIGNSRAEPSTERGVPLGLLLAFVLAAAWAVELGALGILRHLSFQSNAYDLGLQHHVTWNTAHGRWFEYTYMVAFPPYSTNHLADHVNLILLPIAALYWIHDGPETLIVVQALLVASGMIPLFLVARRRLGADAPALVLASLFLLHPGTQAAVLFDFHPIVLCAPLFLWAYWLAHERRLAGLALVALLMLATQENAALVVAMLGVVLFLERLRAIGTALFAAGLAWFATCFFVILPALNPGGSNAFGRYRHLGESALAIVKNLLGDPSILLGRLVGPEGRAYLRGIFLPFGGTSFFAPEILVGAASELALNLLSSFSPQRSIEYQYASVTIAVAALAAVVGTSRIAGWAARRSPFRPPALATVVSACALVASLGMQIGDNGAPRALAADAAGAYAYASERARVGRAIVRGLPPDVPISAQGSVAAHVSERPVVYVFPTVREADWVVLDTAGNRFPVDIQRLPGLETEESYREYARRLVAEEGFRVETERAGWIVLRRLRPAGASAHALTEPGAATRAAPAAAPPPPSTAAVP